MAAVEDIKPLVIEDRGMVCMVSVDFDTAMSLPETEIKTYYTWDMDRKAAERIELLGIHVFFRHDKAGHIMEAWLRFEAGYQITYIGQQIDTVIGIIKERMG